MKKTFVAFFLATLFAAGIGTPMLLSAQSMNAATPLPISPEQRVCKVLYRNLGVGMRGDDVRGLQEFLREKHYLAVEPTGYYGVLTKDAVRKWQASENITTAGAIGPLSRERIKYSCGEFARIIAEPQSGEAPLVVTFTLSVAGLRPYTYALDLGDGQILENIECPIGKSASAPQKCNVPLVVEHRYKKNGNFTAVLWRSASDGVDVRRAVAKASIHVGAVTTYPNPADDPRCKAWYDGCNSCSRETPTSPAMCTLRACTPESTAKPYCTVWFDGTAKNLPPVISNFSGPTTLAANETGTWAISAKDPENGALTYSILWGDEASYTPSSAGAATNARAFTQATTFTHAYAVAGVYTITMLVQDNAGLQAKTSTTVKVGSGPVACTMEYNPVCGRPAGCENTCQPGMYCTMMCKLPEPKTFSNKCFLAAENATLLHEGTCTPASGNM